MANIQFNEDQEYSRPIKPEQKSIFVRAVLATGIVSDDVQVQYVLLGVIVLLVILSIVVWILLNPSNSPTPLPPGTFIP